MFLMIVRQFKCFLLILCMTCWTFPATAEASSPITETIAIVNGVAITSKSYQQEILAVQAQIAQSGKQMDKNEIEKLKKEILNELIDSELLYQDSQKKGVHISEAQIEKELLSIRQRFRSEEALEKGLAEMGMSVAEMKKKLEKSLVIEEFITKQITHGITVAENEIQHYYDSQPELFESPLILKASHILITVSAEANQTDKELAKKKLKGVEDKLKKGADFAELAKKHSDGPSKANGGDIGYFERGEMVKPFEDAAFALAPGETSSIIETQFGFHLIKATDRMQDPPIAYKIAQYDIRKKLELEKSRITLDKYISNLKHVAKIEIFTSLLQE